MCDVALVCVCGDADARGTVHPTWFVALGSVHGIGTYFRGFFGSLAVA